MTSFVVVMHLLLHVTWAAIVHRHLWGFIQCLLPLVCWGCFLTDLCCVAVPGCCVAWLLLLLLLLVQTLAAASFCCRQ
jgi:hypothetical protein